MDKILQTIKKFIPKKVFTFFEPFYHFLLGAVANSIYRWPSNQLIVIGVTGTTGKTTSTYLIAKMLRGAGYKVGYTSTAMFSDGEEDWLNNKKMTMIGRFFTHKLLRKMVDNGCQYAIVETSSEGIVQYRHRFINYDVVLLTCLYPEHIEAHGSFENYKEAKGMLFAHLKNGKTKYVDSERRVRRAEGFKKLNLERVKKTIIVNGDDSHAEYFLDFWAEEKYSFHIKGKSEQHFSDPIKTILASLEEKNGQRFLRFDGQELHLNLMGGFNAQNILAAMTIGLGQGLTWNSLKPSLEAVTGVPGRLEKISEGQPFTVIVDYAFEPGAVEKLYETIEEQDHKRIIHILGSAGGGRDKARRTVLGDLAGRRADIAIITDEDPYDENPVDIIEAVARGAEMAGKERNKNLFLELSRRQAIRRALAMAKPGDIVLITGKGSEQAICRQNGTKEAWDDRRVVREEIKNISKTVDNSGIN